MKQEKRPNIIDSEYVRSLFSMSFGKSIDNLGNALKKVGLSLGECFDNKALLDTLSPTQRQKLVKLNRDLKEHLENQTPDEETINAIVEILKSKPEQK